MSCVQAAQYIIETKEGSIWYSISFILSWQNKQTLHFSLNISTFKIPWIGPDWKSLREALSLITLRQFCVPIPKNLY